MLHEDEHTTLAVKDLGLPPVKDQSPPVNSDELEMLRGPLLNYKGMQRAGLEVPVWYGSVLIVAESDSAQPILKLKYLRVQNQRSQRSQGSQSSILLLNNMEKPDHVRKGSISSPLEMYHAGDVIGVKLYSDPVKAFWRFTIALALQDYEARWQYVLTNVRARGSEPGVFVFRTFVVPSVSQSMRIMFYSCIGFSVGTDQNEKSGPILGNDVLRVHAQKAFHAMIGGDQIYNDGVRVDGTLRPWTDIGNPKKRRDYPFDEDIRAACDSYYFDNYVSSFSMSTSP